MQYKQIAIVSVPVSDQQAAKLFYRDTLGFALVRDNPMGPDQQWIELSPAAGSATITLVTWFEQMPPGSAQGLVLETSDIEADVATLQARGVAVTPLEEAPWGRFTTFADPDGNSWVLQEAL